MSAVSSTGRPNLIKRGDIYYVRVRINGRDKWCSTGHTTLPLAIRRAEEILVELRRDRDWKPAADVPTFGQWVDTYLAVHASPSLAARPAQFDRALKAWRYRPLDEIRPTHVKQFFRAQQGVWNASTTALHHRLLHAVWETARKDHLITVNPLDGVEAPVAHTRDRVLTHEEEAALRTVLRPEGDRWLTVMLGTGLRRGEARALQREWFTPTLIRVPPGVAKGSARAGNGKARAIPLFPGVREAVDTQWAACGQLWPYAPHTVWGWLTRAAKRVGIPPVWPHALRHTFATRYMQGGGNIFTLSKILGHASVTITEHIYAHLQEEDVATLSRGVRLGPAEPPATGATGSATAPAPSTMEDLRAA